MNINPDTVTAAGFSGGSHYANILHVSNSATIKGAGLAAGGPFSFGFSQSSKEGKGEIDSKYIE
jgi:hypothetical protein